MTKIINVYINGSLDSNKMPLNGSISLATLLHHLTVRNDNSLSSCINGCALESYDIRDLYMAFSFHTGAQAARIAREVEQEVNDSEDPIVLNIYGFSRGAIAAFMACLKLKHVDRTQLTINVAAFDPVPLNFERSVKADMFFGTGTTLSSKVADLGTCLNVGEMLVLFTNRPYPGFMGFSPILPSLPDTSHFEVDVMPGKHEDAVAFTLNQGVVSAVNTQSILMFHRIVKFMQNCGTVFDFSRLQFDENLVVQADSEHLLGFYAEAVHNSAAQHDRSMHLNNKIHTIHSEERIYLNRHHQTLAGVAPNDDQCILTVERNPQNRVVEPEFRASL
jgi:hypothetical protein